MLDNEILVRHFACFRPAPVSHVSLSVFPLSVCLSVYVSVVCADNKLTLCFENATLLFFEQLSSIKIDRFQLTRQRSGVYVSVGLCVMRTYEYAYL